MKDVFIIAVMCWLAINVVGALGIGLGEGITDGGCDIEKVYVIEFLFPARLAACSVVWEVSE